MTDEATRDEGMIAEGKSEVELRGEVSALVQRIPSGRVLSYGELGALCDPPISGYICGRIMNGVKGAVPWWRVVAKDGRLPVSKRSPHLAQEQRAHLEAEGVGFDSEGRVAMDRFRAVMVNAPAEAASERQASLEFDEWSLDNGESSDAVSD